MSMSLRRLLLILSIVAIAAVRGAAADAPAIKITEDKDRLDIAIDGKPFTTYRFAPTADDPEWHRPYFFPVLSADGVQLTADRARETVNDQNREHPWHRSVWVGQGDINGVDHRTHPTTGKKLQRHVKFDEIAADTFIEELAWDGKEDGKPVLTEVRTVMRPSSPSFTLSPIACAALTNRFKKT